MAEDGFSVPFAVADAHFIYKFSFVDFNETFACRLCQSGDLLAHPPSKLWKLALRFCADSKFIGFSAAPKFFNGRHATLPLVQGFSKILRVVVIFVLTIESVVSLSRLEVEQGENVQVIVFKRVGACHVSVQFTDLWKSKHLNHISGRNHN